MMIHSVVGLIKKISYKNEYFPKPESHEKNIKVKIDLKLQTLH